MTASSHSSEAPGRRLALRRTEAAKALGVSAEFFAEHVAHELKWIRRGRVVLVDVREVERWLAENERRWSES
jgi:hypothetical protein